MGRLCSQYPARRSTRARQARTGCSRTGRSSSPKRATCSTRSRRSLECGRPSGRRRARLSTRRPDFSTIPPAREDEDRARVAEALGQTPIGVDEIIRHTGLQAAHVFTILLELDLAGPLERASGRCRVACLFGHALGRRAASAPAIANGCKHVAPSEISARKIHRGLDREAKRSHLTGFFEKSSGRVKTLFCA